MLTSVRRRASLQLLVISSVVLSGCAGLDPYGLDRRDEFPDSNVTLTLVQQFDAGSLLYSRGSGGNAPAGRTYSIGYAAAVAARGNDIYVIDRMSGYLLRIDSAVSDVQLLTRLADPGTHGILVARDRTVYVVDKAARAIRQLDDLGRTIRVFADENLIAAPVDITETDWGGTIVIADALSSRLVMFDRLAGAFTVVGSDMSGMSTVRTIHAIASARNDIFVLDSGTNEVTRINMNGGQTGIYGDDELEAPTALAVDDCGRIFIADRSNQGILVSLSDMRVPPARSVPDNFIGQEITDLWVDSNILYVAAGIGGIRTYLIEPQCGA